MPVTEASRDKTILTWCAEFNRGAERMEYLLKGGDGICTIGYATSCDAGSPIGGFQTMGNSIGATRSVISFVRAIPSTFEMFSGRAFFQTNFQGAFKKDNDGHYIAHSWSTIALKICLFVGRIFSPIAWLNRLKVISLGMHTMWVGTVTMISFSLVAVIGLVSSIDSFIKERLALTNLNSRSNKGRLAAQNRKVKMAGWDVASAAADVISAPWDNGALPIGGSLAMTIVGACACTLSSGVFMLKEWCASN